MKYLCVIGKYKRNWWATFPDFPGQILVSASTPKALEGKLVNALGSLFETLEKIPKAKTRTWKEINQDLLEGQTDFRTVWVEAAMVNPVSLEVAQVIQQASVSKAEIAKRMGTTQSVLSRLSDPAYSGHTVGALQRLAAATDSKLKIVFEH